MKQGKLNLITDVKGILVGNSQDSNLKSGVTVLASEKPMAAAVTILGGAPGTRDTDLLEPDKLVQKVDAITLSGGSVYGLDASSGVIDIMKTEDKGYKVNNINVPIVPGAILFDLLNGGDKNWEENPYKNLGRQAYLSKSKKFNIGTTGAGTGATTQSLKGGLGSSSIILDNGITVGALVAVNSFGSVTIPGSDCFWASFFEINNEFGGYGITIPSDPFVELDLGWRSQGKKEEKNFKNTTIAIVATDCNLTKTELKRVSVAAHDGISRSIVPAHTPFDGDLVFAISTGVIKTKLGDGELVSIGHSAATCLSRAIARAVFEASEEPKDFYPTWKKKTEYRE